MINKLKKAKRATKKASSRVDLQVILFVTVYTFFTIVLTGQTYWRYTFQGLMDAQEERVISLYNAVESMLDPATFRDINSPQDVDTPLYQEAMETLLKLKNISDVLYLFTAKVNEEGEFVYVIDGLEPHLDFRFPNDPIEEAIIPKMQRALLDENVMPTSVMHTEWGDIFMAYMPFHDSDGQVIGVVGIEFDATSNYETYRDLQETSLVLGILIIISAAVISAFLFRRISNPLYLDKNTQDLPTGLKNRNAYEVDLNNLIARGHNEHIGVVVADINGLKEVNDRLGHKAGDSYISLVADAIRETKKDTMVGYRTGGDEFVIFVQDATEESLKKFVQICSSRVRSQKTFSDMRCSLACGYCMFDGTQDKTLEDTFNRADKLMYTEKRRQKDAEER